LIYKLDIFY